MAELTKSDSEEQLEFQLTQLLGPVIAFRIRLFFAGVVFPIGTIVTAAYSSATIDVPWQSGNFRDYVAMLLTWPGYGPFLPLIGFSQICLTVWLIAPSLGRHLIIRLGIYTGLVLSLQFLLFVLMTSAIVTFIAAAFVGPIFALIVATAVRIPRRTRRFAIRHLLILTTVVAVIIAVARLLGVPLNSLVQIVLGVLVCILIATPALCALAYTRATIEVARQTELTSSKYKWLTAMVIWMISWVAAWKLAVDIMLVEYSKLPVTDPNCYVSSAAAHGHRSFVGTRQSDNGVRPINLQVRRLKFLEIALKASLPSVHCHVRRFYDHVGPILARQCQRSAWLADATFVILKPIEWTSEIIRRTLRIRSSSVQRLYGGESED